MVGNPVPDIGLQRMELAFDKLCRSNRSVNLQGRIALGHNPVRGDHVVQGTHVITVEMGDEHTRQESGQRAGPSHTHDRRPTSVDQDVGVINLDQRRRPRSIGIRQW